MGATDKRDASKSNRSGAPQPGSPTTTNPGRAKSAGRGVSARQAADPIAGCRPVWADHLCGHGLQARTGYQ